MSNATGASEIVPDLLASQRLFDAPASDPAAGLLFLVADRGQYSSYSAQHLSNMLTAAYDQKASEAHAPPLELKSIRSRLSRLISAGYFHAVPRMPDYFALKPGFLSYKRQLVTGLIKLGLDFPDIPVADMLGKAKTHLGRTPSISLALYRMIMDQDDHLLPTKLDNDLLGQYGLGYIPRLSVHKRITTLNRKGIMEKGADGTRLRADLLPFAARLVQCMGELTLARVSDPKANQAAIEQAETILTDQVVIQSLLLASKRPSVKRQATPAPSQPAIHTSSPLPDPAQSLLTRLGIRPGVYPANWLTRGECQEDAINPDLFFIDPGKRESVAKIKKAQSFCRKCEVRGPCLRAALLTKDQHNIAALTPKERASLTSEERRAILDSVTVTPPKWRP